MSQTTKRRGPATIDMRGTSSVQNMITTVADWLTTHSIAVLRISLGLVFLGFGLLKFVPGASPAEDLAVATLEKLTFGIVSGGAALLLTAVVECFLGLTLLTGKLLRVGLVVMAGALVGIMSPLVLFFTELFPGAPTLEAQYVLKDIVFAAAAMVLAAGVMGARMVRPEDPSVSSGS